MRALIAVCLLASAAHAELPTIDTEFPPTLRIDSPWGTRIDRVSVEVSSAPETSFVKIDLGGRGGWHEIDLDLPVGTKVVGLGVDGVDGAAWGRAMPVRHAEERRRSQGGSSLRWTSTSADQDHLKLHVNVPATVELALYFPPIPRLAIDARAGAVAVAVAGERVPTARYKRVVVELEDIAGTTGDVALAAVSETVGLVAAPASVTDFLEAPANSSRFGVHMVRDLDKAMIRRRMKWFRAGLRQCFMQTAQWSALRSGGAIVSFMITPEGTVAWAHTSESDLPEAVNKCLVETVQGWEFPAADSNVQVNYPLTFAAVE